MKEQQKSNQKNPETLVTLQEVMRVYGGKKSYWYKAKDLQGLPYYKLSGVRFRLSEVERWVQQRKIINEF